MTVVGLTEAVGPVGARPALAAVTGSAPAAASRRALDRSRGTVMASCDGGALVIGFAAGAVVRCALLGSVEGPAFVGRSVLQEAPYIIVYLLFMSAYGLYGRSFRRIRRSWFFDFGQLAHSLVTGSVTTIAISSALHRVAGLPKVGLVETAAMSLPALALVPASRGIGSLLARRQGVVRSRVAVVGTSPATERLVRRLQRVPDIRLVGLITDDVPGEGGSASGAGPDRAALLGGTRDLVEICLTHRLDRIFVGSSSHEAEQLGGILRRLPADVQVSIVPTFGELLTWQSQVEDVDGLTVMAVPSVQLGLGRRTAKRTLDLTVSALTLMALAPVLVLVAAAVKLTSSGPVLFRQTRIGYQGRPFRIAKFRTMDRGADVEKVALLGVNELDGPMFKIRSDPRLTPVGGFLRRTSLDELPQLFNVLVGQMSLVGPRPLVPEESACIDGWASRRFEVKPGMTGLWQVSGRSDLPFEELRQLDYAYAASWSLWWDLRILWQTPASVLLGRGAY